MEKKEGLFHISTLKYNLLNEKYKIKVSTNSKTAFILDMYLTNKKKTKEELDDILKKEFKIIVKDNVLALKENKN